MKQRKSDQRGFMEIVLLAIIVIATLAYFDIDLRAFFENPIVKKIVEIFVSAWNLFLKPLLVYLWVSFGTLIN